MRIQTRNDVRTPIEPSSYCEWAIYKADIKKNLRFSSGIDLLYTDIPLNPIIIPCAEYDTFVIEKVIIQTLKGYYLCGNLYRPKDTTKKYPCVLNPHGHWENGRVEMQEIAKLPVRFANLAMRGIVAFAYDMVGYCDTTQISHHYYSKEEEKYGFSRFALQTLNSVKALDFVCTLPYVDENRIGCTGASGGGTQTYFLTLIDDRIKACAPINMASLSFQGGCICENTAYLRQKYNNIDYVSAIAPRPLFMSASDGDWTNESPEREFPHIERIYDIYGALDRFEHFYQHAPHCYNKPIRERVYDFFCRNFGIENIDKNEIDVEIDTENLKIGDIRAYVPTDDFISSNEEMTELAIQTIKDNYERLSEREKAYYWKRILLNDIKCDPDIMYTVDDTEKVIEFGKCPDEDILLVEYFTCYNVSPDAERLNGIINLMKEYPDYSFKASGKSAAIVSSASKITGHKNTELDFDEKDMYSIDIPMFGLLMI